MSDLTRREFMKCAGAAGITASLAPVLQATAAKDTSKPNILVIVTDQQSASMMSCTGNPYLKTPAMDWLAENGVRFERAYPTNPVCAPARFSFQTGCYPSVVGMRSNGDSRKTTPFSGISTNTLGHLMRNAGYETAYGGKVHLPQGAGLSNVAKIGYDVIAKNERDGLASACANYLKKKRHKPFFLFASFINPHDICYMAIHDYKKKTRMPKPMANAMKLPPGVTAAEFYAKHCPPAPANFEPTKDEPKAIVKYMKKRAFKFHARETWDEKKWRLHRWAYCRLTEKVDGQIQVVLDALKESDQLENTVIVFTSDHGDVDGAHRIEHKSVFYEEAVRIPFIITQPGKTSKTVNQQHLINNGLDLMPTLCDYAGIAPPKNLLGMSVRPLVKGMKPENWRDECVLESELGRYLIVDGWKYCKLDLAGAEEVLFNTKKDPGEMVNLANSPAHKDKLEEMRQRLNAWQKRTGITFKSA